MRVFTAILVCLSVMLAVCAAKPKKGGGRKLVKAPKMVGGHWEDIKTTNFIVSIKNVPYDYHKCAGFLVSKRHVVTTATCLYPADKGHLQAYVKPIDLDYLFTGYVLKDWVIHQNYSVLPLQNDIGVAVLENPIPDDIPFLSLPGVMTLPRDARVTTYGWGYQKVKDEEYGNFTLHSKDLRVMSNAMCSLVLHEYLGCNYICATSDNKFASAPSDVGTPLVYRNDAGLYAAGMLIKSTDNLVSAATFLSLNPYNQFIIDVMEVNTNTEAPSPTDVPNTTTTSTESDYEEEDDEDDEEYDPEDEGEESRRSTNSRRRSRPPGSE